jgi:hypothetical protein
MDVLLKLKYFLAYHGYCSKPDFLVIGAQKAGTTSLTSMLRQHPNIAGSTRKEVHFFDHDDWFAKRNWSSYHSYFPLPLKVKKNTLLFESTPNYLYHPKVAERIFHYNPKIKLVILLRNPSLRALSGWTMYHDEYLNSDKYPSITESFEECINREIAAIQNSTDALDTFGIVGRGLYLNQIRKYLKFFNRNQLHVLSLEELVTNFNHHIAGLFDFLEVPHEDLTLVHQNKKVSSNTSSYQNELVTLKEFYQPYNEDLWEFLGYELDW